MNSIAISHHLENIQTWVSDQIEHSKGCPILGIFINIKHECYTKLYPFLTQQSIEDDLGREALLRQAKLIILIYPSKILRRGDTLELLGGKSQDIEIQETDKIECVTMAAHDIDRNYHNVTACEVVRKNDKFSLGEWREYDYDTLLLKGENF